MILSAARVMLLCDAAGVITLIGLLFSLKVYLETFNNLNTSFLCSYTSFLVLSTCWRGCVYAVCTLCRVEIYTARIEFRRARIKRRRREGGGRQTKPHDAVNLVTCKWLRKIRFRRTRKH